MKKGNLVMMALLAVSIVATMLGVVQLLSSSHDGHGAITTSDLGLFKSFSRGKPGIGIVKVYGPIYTQDEGASFGLPKGGADDIVKQLDEYRRDDMIKAVILRVNSPGGTLGASQEIADAVLRFRQSGKKIIVSMGDVAASGGYYIAAHAHKIIANRGTITGSIGVISAGLNLTKLMEKHGVSMNVIKQGKNKDLFAYWRDMTAEERQLLDELTRHGYDQFVETISKGRNIPINDLLPIADGRVFTGEQALEYKLVDELGGLTTAIRIAAKEVGLDPDDDPSIIYEKGTGLQRLFSMMQTRQSPGHMDSFLRYIANSSIPVLYYCSIPLPESMMRLSLED